MEIASADRALMTGEMRLGVIPTIGPFLLPRVLPALRERFPELTIYLREEQTVPLLARLQEGELDSRPDRAALRYRGPLCRRHPRGRVPVRLQPRPIHSLAPKRSRAKRSGGRTAYAARGGTLPARPRAGRLRRRETRRRGRSSRPAACTRWCRWWRRGLASPSSRASRSRPGSRKGRASRSRRSACPLRGRSGWPGAARP